MGAGGFISKLLRKKEEKVDIQVGLDFGTSATKVMYKQIGGKTSKVVNFNHGLPHFPDYCLPSLAAIDNRGKLLLGIDAARFLLGKPWDAGLQRLKVIVAGNCDNSFLDPITKEKYSNYCCECGLEKTLTPEKLTAIYLAHVMFITKEYIRSQEEYQDAEINFMFNICLPIDHIQNNKTKDAFEKIFGWAERIEKEWYKERERFDPLAAAEALRDKPISSDTRVFAIPESVAQIAAYLLSLQRQEKLHAVIDFGAGTTDISIFNCADVMEDSATWWFAAKNMPRGTINIERALSSQIINTNNKAICNQSEIYKCFQDIAKVSLKKLDPHDGKIKILGVIRKELEYLRQSKEYKNIWEVAYSRYPDFEKWKDIDVFICGGGAGIPFVQETFSMSWKDPLKTRFTVKKIPRPDDYDADNTNAPFERMSVAYGLAIPKPQLEKHVLPDDVPEYKVTRRSVRERNHEDTYSEK